MPDPYASLYGAAQAVKSAGDPYASLYGAPAPASLPAVPAPNNHGAGGSWGDPSGMGAAKAIAQQVRGEGEQVRAGAGQIFEAGRHLPSTLANMGKSALHDLDIVGRLVSAGEGNPSEGVANVPGRDMVRAGVNTAANAALPMAGAMGLVPRLAVNAGLGAINDQEEPIRGATAGLLTGELLHAGGEAFRGGRARMAGDGKLNIAAPAGTDADLAAADPNERNAGLSVGAKTRANIRNAYRSALVTPYANIEQQAPALSEALMAAGGANMRAEHIGSTRMGRVLNGLSDDQRSQFGTQLTYDNLVAEADRKNVAAIQATDPAEVAALHTAADNFNRHAYDMQPRLMPGIQEQPWFQQALAQYRTNIEGPLTQDAIASGVNPASLRQPASAYVRLASEARLDDAEMRRALDVAGVSDPSDLQQRPALLRKLIGENPALKRYFARNAQGARQGPLAANAGYPGEPGPFAGKRVGVTGSSNMAQGTAANYVTDLSRIVDFDARDKAVKASRNRILTEVANVGRPLEEGEAPAPAMKVLAFDDRKGLVNGDVGVQRYEVTPEVHEAVNRFYQGASIPSTAAQSFRKFNDFATRAQIAGMPVEAMSHGNTLTSLISKVPGEKDALGRAIASIPGVGSKVASLREMAGIDFSDPDVQALENRLSDIGALRSTVNHEGLVNTAHNWLFGDPRTPSKIPGLNQLQGIDTRARLVLARKYLDRAPDASDADLREFITSQVGNYNAQNAGALPNFMAKGSFLSPFARFQSARIPTSIKRVVGVSDLPARSGLQRGGDVANTLYRGPLGYVAAAELANRALTGHGTKDNDSGHALDVNTGLYAVSGGLKRMTAADAQAQYGDKASPVYLPASTLDPVTYAGLRATGLRALVPALSPEQPGESRAGNAVRDMTNVALGTSGPLMRGLQTALTGTQPYVQPDGTFLRVTPRHFGATSDLTGNVAAAIGMANPAIHALTASGGDASRTLAGAMAQDGRFMGGPASIFAKVAEFTMPRLLAPAIGGRTNEQSMDAQMDRRYREAVADYANRIKDAPGPVAQRIIIDDARRDAGRNGFNPDAVEVALQKVQSQDRDAVAARNNANMQRRAKQEFAPRP